MEDAVPFAVCCGSIACTVAEVIPSLPRRGQVERMLSSLREGGAA
jgi:hypothetical protein